MPTPGFYIGGNMAKSVKKIPWTNIGLVIAAGFVWTKLGLGAAAKDVGVVFAQTPLKPDGTCPAGWLRSGNKCIKL